MIPDFSKRKKCLSSHRKQKFGILKENGRAEWDVVLPITYMLQHRNVHDAQDWGPQRCRRADQPDLLRSADAVVGAPRGGSELYA